MASLPVGALASPAVQAVSRLEMVGASQAAFMEGAADSGCRGDAPVLMAFIRLLCIVKVLIILETF
jgi:hypothetical protein